MSAAEWGWKWEAVWTASLLPAKQPELSSLSSFVEELSQITKSQIQHNTGDNGDKLSSDELIAAQCSICLLLGPESCKTLGMLAEASAASAEPRPAPGVVRDTEHKRQVEESGSIPYLFPHAASASPAGAVGAMRTLLAHTATTRSFGPRSLSLDPMHPSETSLGSPLCPLHVVLPHPGGQRWGKEGVKEPVRRRMEL